jgi:hypothetical protein
MTTDELERDLKTLAEPQPDDEGLRLAIRATLVEQLQGRRKGIRRRTRLVFGAAALAAATAAAAIVALVGFGGSGGPSAANAAILARVVHSMSPPANMIVHVKETGVQADGTPVAAEWWQETNAPYAMRLIKGAVGGEHEGATDGTTTCSLYDPGTNTIYQHTNCASSGLIDPVESARAALRSGTAQVAGTVTIDGQSLYKIELPNGVIGYFDQTDYRPVYLDNPQGDGSVVRTHVLAYEELPLTPENEKLLSLTAQHPDARVETSAAPTKVETGAAPAK